MGDTGSKKDKETGQKQNTKTFRFQFFRRTETPTTYWPWVGAAGQLFSYIYRS
jgi:hypothetical protein